MKTLQPIPIIQLSLLSQVGPGHFTLGSYLEPDKSLVQILINQIQAHP